MLSRIVRALIVAVAVTLGVLLLGVILLTINVQIAQIVGGFLKTYAAAIGVLAGLWLFFSGSTWPTRNI